MVRAVKTTSRFYELIKSKRLDSISTGLTQGGVTATLSSDPSTYINTVSGASHDMLLNRTAASFGINVEGLMNTGGCTGEESAQLDDGCTAESIVIELSSFATLVNIKVSSFGADLGLLDFEKLSLTDIDITSTGFLNVGQTVGPSGNRFSISFISGNGFSFDQFTIETQVPEPSTLGLLGAGLLGLWFRKRAA